MTTPTATRIALLALVTLAALGCRNNCQQLCAEMADYAEECGLPVTDADLKACMDRHAAPTPEDRETCAEFGDPDVIRAQWACEELGRYWGADG